MKYIEGLAIAQKYGLETEYNDSYNWSYKHYEDEEQAVLDALKEWDLAPEDAEVGDTLIEW